jgi:hypothetical protein
MSHVSAKRGARFAAKQAGARTNFTGTPCKYGHTCNRETSSGQCLECKALRDAAKRTAHRLEYNARKTRERGPHRGKLAEYAKLARDTEPEDVRIARLARAREKAREWRAANPKHHLALTTAHKRAVKQRTPAWVDMATIVDVYKKCPDGYQVDHIIPIRGSIVSGLHVPWNLQYLRAEENRRKSNHFDPNKTLPV